MAKSIKSGIDIDLGNQCSRTAYSWAKKSFGHRPAGSGNPLIAVDGVFSNVMNYQGIKVGISSDGIGTKIELAERTGIYNTLGFDLVAMTVDDLAANGIEPVNLSNILDVDHLDHDIIDSLMQGLYEAAKVARITVTGGEIAELGNRIGGYGERMHFNWCSTATGIVPEGHELIDGSGIKPGQIVVSLASRGFRSNGFSLIRTVLEDAFGPKWHEIKYDRDRTWGETLLTHSRIYSPLVTDLIRSGIPIYGVAHITGGGIAENFKRVLKTSRCGADLLSIYNAHDIMKSIQKMGNVPERTAYRLWNMGNGMLLVTDEKFLPEINKLSEKYGYPVCKAGIITDEPVIRLQSSGCKPRILQYPLK
ncbi:MAG TPA: phosphoribosylformylglycinamidine cyclo-ligase [Candidatus Marinimicrobia bacterium]|nr:phosphoribosylformylglycinamidine cyclo-ligase [Candidatus Neomarinimicrobiota bacterium]